MADAIYTRLWKIIDQMGGVQWLTLVSIENLFAYLVAMLPTVSMEITQDGQVGWITLSACENQDLTLSIYIFQKGALPELYYRTSKKHGSWSDYYVRETSNHVATADYKSRIDKCEKEFKEIEMRGWPYQSTM